MEELNVTGDAVDGRVEGCLSQAEAHLTIVSVPMFVVEASGDGQGSRLTEDKIGSLLKVLTWALVAI